jgi:hypothetical protein
METYGIDFLTPLFVIYISNHPHHQLGEVELGGYDAFNLITNPPLHMLKQQIKGHAEFAVQQVRNKCIHVYVYTYVCI